MTSITLRYLLFHGCFWSNGGWDDFQGSFDTLAEARDALSKTYFEWYQIVDLETGVVLRV